MKPTMYLRVQDRKEFVSHAPHVTPGQSMPPIEDKTVRVVQQFWEHYDGKEAAGDMFTLVTGSWVDLPLVRA